MCPKLLLFDLFTPQAGGQALAVCKQVLGMLQAPHPEQARSLQRQALCHRSEARLLRFLLLSLIARALWCGARRTPRHQLVPGLGQGPLAALRCSARSAHGRRLVPSMRQDTPGAVVTALQPGRGPAAQRIVVAGVKALGKPAELAKGSAVYCELCRK